ncbi:MAG: UDP-N-acetylmuramate dehydrogenase [Clostridia bacterium]|nr:UDP-N-acetylmuramate dehydrogenase [Clostridia bacterium]
MNGFIKLLTENRISFSENEPMSRHTTFKIGGNADIFVTVKTEEELILAAGAAKAAGVPFFICGRGSDLLVSDKGIEGAVICLSGMEGVAINGDTVTVSAGQSMVGMCLALQKAGLSGFEFAYGIPGTVGGAVYMNAGAYGGEIKDNIVSARFLTAEGEIKEIKKEDMRLAYRTSIFQQNGGVILSAVFRFEKGDKAEIFNKMEDYMSRRKAKQPLEYPSAGSVFKRPEGNFAGALIEKSGLKGERCGGAMVSDKHCGFIVNTGGATCADVMRLIEKIQEKVLAESKVKLEREVIYVGR